MEVLFDIVKNNVIKYINSVFEISFVVKLQQKRCKRFFCNKIDVVIKKMLQCFFVAFYSYPLFLFSFYSDLSRLYCNIL